MCDYTQQILWIKSLFCECHLTLDHVVMFGDNKGAINIRGAQSRSLLCLQLLSLLLWVM